MKIVSLFLESFRVASQMGNARTRADMDRAERQIGACCDESPGHDSKTASVRETGGFPGPYAKHA